MVCWNNTLRGNKGRYCVLRDSSLLKFQYNAFLFVFVIYFWQMILCMQGSKCGNCAKQKNYATNKYTDQIRANDVKILIDIPIQIEKHLQTESPGGSVMLHVSFCKKLRSGAVGCFLNFRAILLLKVSYGFLIFSVREV